MVWLSLSLPIPLVGKRIMQFPSPQMPSGYRGHCTCMVYVPHFTAGINVANFISITGWLLGPSATKMLRLLPSVIGKISLGIYEVERVSHIAD